MREVLLFFIILMISLVAVAFPVFALTSPNLISYTIFGVVLGMVIGVVICIILSKRG